MNKAFRNYVSSSRAIAERSGLRWSLPVNRDGSIDPEFAWNITQTCKAATLPTWRLNDLGSDAETLAVINERRAAVGDPAVSRSSLSLHWQDLVKAAVVQQVLVARNTPQHVVTQVARPLRVLATCMAITSVAEPWEIGAEDIRLATQIAADVQKSGKLAQVVGGLVRKLLDARHLCDRSPLWEQAARLGAANSKPRGRKMLNTLQERAHEEKLPEAEALWELVDIVFTREPETFTDEIRFAQLRTQLLCGMRIGEVCALPADWKRNKEYVTLEGRPAGDVGGISRSLMLRHFAEKQQGADDNSVELVEAFQHVPAEFEDIVDDTLTRSFEITQPLRQRLRRQIETGRPFPEFDPDELVPLTDMYTRLTGILLIRDEQPPEELLVAYQRSRDPKLLAQVGAHQRESPSPFTASFQTFWWKWRQQQDAAPIRDAQGVVQANGRKRAGPLFLRTRDVEEHVLRLMPTKLSDTTPSPLSGGGQLQASKLLFLMPKRALIEGRNGGICDITRYFAVGRVDPNDLTLMLSGNSQGIFARYGQTEAARALSLESHSLRHMQNTVLFQTGISDAAITKRFNRKSVAQSYEYDQRTLAQQMEAIDLPPAAKGLPDRAKTVARMIIAGKAKGAITDEFKRVQRERGDEQAFDFLAAEADGFHATPYGQCVNGFTQEPCPKHLQCTSGCNHFVNSGLDRNVANIRKLLEKTERALVEIRKRMGGAGWESQLRHAETHARNLRLVLETAEGEKPFPDGEDLSKPIMARTALDV